MRGFERFYKKIQKPALLAPTNQRAAITVANAYPNDIISHTFGAACSNFLTIQRKVTKNNVVAQRNQVISIHDSSIRAYGCRVMIV